MVTRFLKKIGMLRKLKHFQDIRYSQPQNTKSKYKEQKTIINIISNSNKSPIKRYIGSMG